MREQMVDEKIEGPSSVWKEAEDLMQMVRKHKMHEDQVDVDVMASGIVAQVHQYGMECVERFAGYLTEEEGEQHGKVN